MALINEKETSFELLEALLKYIETLQVAGAVLIFLPGWNLIYSMQRHLETNPHFGKPSGNSGLDTCNPPFVGVHSNPDARTKVLEDFWNIRFHVTV